MGIYRAGLTTMGFLASRLYELDDDELDDPRVVSMIAAGWLIEQPPTASFNHGSRLPIENDSRYDNGTGPYVEDASTLIPKSSVEGDAGATTTASPSTVSRHGVPAIP